VRSTDSSDLEIERADLSKLFHQVDLGMQAPGSIDDGYITIVVDGVLYRFVGDSSGISIHAFAVKFAAYSFSPYFELIYCGSSESIACAQDDFEALLWYIDEPTLPIVVVLPTPFTPTTMIMAGLCFW
jgi:hypothetical protein